MLIRKVRREDYEAIRQIYGQYIDTNVTFEIGLPSKETWEKRVEGIFAEYPYIVCEEDGRVIGYAYAGRHHERAAFNWTAEASVYIDKEARGRGIGTALYKELMRRMAKQNLKTVLAILLYPNKPSEALHEKLGFHKIGVMHKMGYKNGTWNDDIWFEKSIGEYEEIPAPFIPRWRLNPKAVLFDLDDTLVHFESAADKAWTAAAKEYLTVRGRADEAEEFSEILLKNREEYYLDCMKGIRERTIGVSGKYEIAERSLLQIGISGQAERDELIVFYEKSLKENVRLTENATEVLAALKEKGIKLAIVSNGQSDSQRDKIKRFDLEKYFDEIIIDAEEGVGKPDSGIFECALERLLVEPSEAWMVGDNLVNDIWGAKQCGILSIWFKPCGKGHGIKTEAVPDITITDMKELLQYVEL